MTRRYARAALGGAIAFVLACAPVAPAGQATVEKAKTLVAARGRYYNLRKSGLLEIQGRIQTNWDLLLSGSDVKLNTRALLNALPFSFFIDSESQLHLEHGNNKTSANQTAGDELESLLNGMDASVSSFFSTWSIFLLTSPFPDVGSNYELEKRPDGYKFSQRQGTLEVTIEADNDFAINEIRVSGPELTASLKPVFEKTANGLLLKGYFATSRRRSGARESRVEAKLDYETLSGLHILYKATLDTTFQGTPTTIEWTFTDCQVKVR